MKVSVNNQVVFCHVLGEGPKKVIALHGYGETGAVFAHLARELSASHTFICPDLPLHGATQWPPECRFGKAELTALVREICRQSAIESLVLAGFSMGGRLVLSIVPGSPVPLEEIWLLASDGFHRNPWYWLATQTGPGNRLFRYTMNHPAWFLSLVEASHRLRIINRSIRQFTRHFLVKEAEREALYQRWTFYRDFALDKPAFRKAVHTNRFPVRQFFGRFDRIIPPSNARWLKDNLPELERTYILETGHRLLDPPNAANIANLLRQPLPILKPSKQ